MLRFVHNHADGFLVAFKIPFHGAEHPGSGSDGISLAGEFTQVLADFFQALAPGGLAQGKACNNIIGRGDLFLCLVQLVLGLAQCALCFLSAGIPGGEVAFQLGQALCILADAFFQAAHIRLSAGNIRRQGGFLPPQLQKAAGHALGTGRHGGQLLLKRP